MTQIKYQITSSKFNGNLLFGLTGDVFTLIENNSDLSKEQMNWMLGVLSKGSNLKQLAQRVSGQLSVVPTDLSFESFWNAYNWKRNRYRAEPLWNKMTEAERIECLLNIPQYHHWQRQNNVAMLNPDNYLKRAEYKTNWTQLKRRS